jgi:hypothetical protein
VKLDNGRTRNDNSDDDKKMTIDDGIQRMILEDPIIRVNGVTEKRWLTILVQKSRWKTILVRTSRRTSRRNSMMLTLTLCLCKAGSW